MAAEDAPRITFERGGFDLVQDVVVIAPDDIWGLGLNGLVHYDGHGWRLVHLFEDRLALQFWNAFDAHEGKGWAVGWPTGEDCTLLRFDHGTWSYDSLPLHCILYDVSVTPSGQAWAVGIEGFGDNDFRSLMLHYDGAQWRQVEHPLGRRQILAVMMASDTLGWASVSGQMSDGGTLDLFLHWDGRAWREVPAPPLRHRQEIRSIDGVAADDVWAVGGIYYFESQEPIQDQRLILHFDGSAWRVVHDDDGNVLQHVEALAHNDVWATGELGDVLRFNGQAWENVIYRRGSVWEFLNIGVIGPDDMWFVGARAIMHRQGDTWRYWGGSGYRDYYSGGQGLTSITMLPDETGWAVGGGGPLLRRRDGHWDEVLGTPPKAEQLYKIASLGADEAWASYLHSLVKPRLTQLAHFDGNAWITQTLMSRLPVSGFAALAPDDVWALAVVPGFMRSDLRDDPAIVFTPPRSEIWHFDGRAWRMDYAFDIFLNDLVMVSPDEGWAVGEKLLHYRDGIWTEEPMPEGVPLGAAYLHSVAFDTPLHGWMIGAGMIGEEVVWSAYEYRDGQWHRRHGLRVDQDANDALWGEIDIAPNGDVWVAGRYTVWWYDGRVWRNFRMPVSVEETTAYQFNGVEITVRDGGYTVWMAGMDDTIARIDVDRPPPPPATPDPRPVKAFLPELRLSGTDREATPWPTPTITPTPTPTWWPTRRPPISPLPSSTPGR